MRFTKKGERIIGSAKDYAFSCGEEEIGFPAVVVAIAYEAEGIALLAECFGLAPEEVRASCPAWSSRATCPGRLRLAEPLRTMLNDAQELAENVPDRTYPGAVDLRHLVCALAMSQGIWSVLHLSPISSERARSLLSTWYRMQLEIPKLDELTDRLRGLRTELLSRVYGQDHAVYAFVEGVFNSEVVAAADTERRSPRGVFVFAGPPGVGKTFLAELGSDQLGLPYKRFDMSAYSGSSQHEALVGMARSFMGAHPGTLTEFVEKNPTAVLLFDEIEKASTKTIHLFLQILDAGTLEDKYAEKNVDFRDVTIIFTTNVGRKLYDIPNASGVHSANARFHRRTILDALENERDPETRQPFFPPAICSRLATGYPVLFNHLGINELERVARSELARMAGLFERQYYKRVSSSALIPLCLLLREGARVDARTLRSQAEAFLKTEIYKFCQLVNADRLEDLLDGVDEICIRLDAEIEQLEPEIRALFEQEERPCILLVANPTIASLYRERMECVEWLQASTAEDALEILASNEVDFVLLDIWIGRDLQSASMTIRHFDHVPVATRSLEKGQELLRKIRERTPDVPVFLLSLAESDGEGRAKDSIDEELFLACVRAGGARGLLTDGFEVAGDPGAKERIDRFSSTLVEAARLLHREKAAARMGQERKVLGFDTVPQIDLEARKITIRLRNLRLTRAIASADAGEVLDEIERPRIKFEDVIGADAAKEELRFFIDYLRRPRRFAALGLKPPSGVLLHGPPGTGKTMLARAMAGESDVAFVSASASQFVTIWQGSGPQSVRDLFARARRYAPAIIFIDEIDAVGKTRAGSAGAGRAEENTLNALFTEMDGFTSPSQTRPVFILAATNFKVSKEQDDSGDRPSGTLDPALVRRFSRTVLVDLPDRAARLRYLRLRLEERPGCTIPDQIINLVAERSPGMSIANLEMIIETAARQAARTNGELTGELLEEALETTRFGEARPRNPEDVRRTACHEAGHTVMYWLSGWLPSYVTVVSRDGHGGYMAPCSDEIERRGSRTRDQLLASIRVNLGGRGAELIHYGPNDGLSTGVSADLENATNTARAMLCRYGMDSDFGLLATPELLKYEGALSSPVYLKLNEAATKLLKQEMDNTTRLLEEHRQHLDAVAEALAQEERLTEENIRAILPFAAGQQGSG